MYLCVYHVYSRFFCCYGLSAIKKKNMKRKKSLLPLRDNLIVIIVLWRRFVDE